MATIIIDISGDTTVTDRQIEHDPEERRPSRPEHVEDVDLEIVEVPVDPAPTGPLPMTHSDLDEILRRSPL